MADHEKTARIYCNHCKSTTRHNIVGSHEYHLGEGEGTDEWGEYRLWACAGCDTCTMEDRYTADYMSAPSDDDSADYVYESIYHPKRAQSIRAGKSFFNLPHKLSQLYREVISSYNDDLGLLRAAGLRSLIEGVCADKKIDGRNLEERIERMDSVLPKTIVTNLHGFRFIGNRAVHELESPGRAELTLALDVIEDILNFLYALNYKANLFGRLKASQGEAAATAPVPARADQATQSAHSEDVKGSDRN